MTDKNAAFVGSIPENYDRFLGPTLFEPYASDLIRRLQVAEGGTILEIACGTGILTRLLRDHVSPTVKIVATDLNEAMIEQAEKKFRANENVKWKQADAVNLPFADKSFSAAICQFGVMFVPDKHKAFREIYRVLEPGGNFAFNVWDSMESNDLALVAHSTISGFFARDPPNFYEVPFSFHEPAEILAHVKDAGFRDIVLQSLKLPSISRSAAELSKGLVEGNPVIGEIRERATAAISEIETALTNAVTEKFGDQPVKANMQAFVCTCVK